MKRKGTSVFLIAMMLFGMVMSAFAQAKPIELKIGHFAPPNTPYDDWAKEFKKEVEAASNGKYRSPSTRRVAGPIGRFAGGPSGGHHSICHRYDLGYDPVRTRIRGCRPSIRFQGLASCIEVFGLRCAKKLFALSDKVGIKSLSSMPRGFRHVTSNKAPSELPPILKD